jgi:hypothetical protein
MLRARYTNSQGGWIKRARMMWLDLWTPVSTQTLLTTKALPEPCNKPMQTDPQNLFLTAAFENLSQQSTRRLRSQFSYHLRDSDTDLECSHLNDSKTSLILIRQNMLPDPATVWVLLKLNYL